MTKLFTLSVALAAATLFFEAGAQAQMYQQGYEFGAGWNSGRFGYGYRPGAGYGNFFRDFNNFRPIQSELTLERPPYFAQFPPVYYSHVVPRPYGVSPYAVPGGIAPVEMSVPVYLPNPTTIRNQHFHDKALEEPMPAVTPSKESENAKAEQTSARKTNKTGGWIKNPYFVRREGLIASK